MNSEELIKTIAKVGSEAWETDDIDRLTDKAEDKLSTKGLSDVKEKCMLIWDMLCDYRKGIYQDIPWKTVCLITGAIVYFVCPVDIVPDFIPFVGLSDDALVISAVVSSCVGDVKRYFAWKQQSVLQDYLDNTVGNDESSRAAEVQRLASMYTGKDVTDVTEQAYITVRQILE